MAEKERNTGECQIQNSQIADEFLQNYTEQAAQKLPVFYRTGILCFPVIMSRRRRAAICCRKKRQKKNIS